MVLAVVVVVVMVVEVEVVEFTESLSSSSHLVMLDSVLVLQPSFSSCTVQFEVSTLAW